MQYTQDGELSPEEMYELESMAKWAWRRNPLARKHMDESDAKSAALRGYMLAHQGFDPSHPRGKFGLWVAKSVRWQIWNDAVVASRQGMNFNHGTHRRTGDEHINLEPLVPVWRQELAGEGDEGNPWRELTVGAQQERAFDLSILTEHLRQAWETLPPDQQRAVYMVAIEGCSTRLEPRLRCQYQAGINRLRRKLHDLRDDVDAYMASL